MATTITGTPVSSAATGRISGGDRYTFHDLLRHLEDFIQGYGVSCSREVIRRAAMRGYDQVVHGWEWSFLRDVYRVHAYAAQTDGTVEYDHDTYSLTITDSTWPAWATQEYGAAVYLDDVVCDVERLSSSTVITLSSDRNPGADIASGESYTLFPRWYPLPDDFLRLQEILGEGYYSTGQYVPFPIMVERHKYLPSTGELSLWSVGPNPNGGHALYVYPALDSTERLDIPYKKRPQDIKLSGNESAEFSGTIGISGTVVTGTGTSWTSAMEGSVLRVSSDATAPSGLESNNPYSEEHTIRSVNSATEIVLETSAATVSGRGFRISDPIDVERTVWDAVIHCSETQLARMRNLKEYRQIQAGYEMAMRRAKEADTPAGPRRVCGLPVRRATRLTELRIDE